MTTSALFFTIFYSLMSVCFILPPSEFLSLGLTVQYMFSNWLGSENECFIQYHIRRTVITLICHSLLPLGYLFGLSCTEDANLKFVFYEGSIFWHLFVYASIICPMITMYIVYCWYKSRWTYHPLAKTIQRFCNQNSSWATVASDINTEFRRIDKICIETNSVTKVIATDNWIIRVLPYWLDIAHQSDAALILTSSDTHNIAPSSPGGVQYLNIEVKSTRTGVKPFFIRLNALDFRDLQDKISRPIMVLQNVTFHRTLVDKFLDAFREQIAQNPVYESSEDPETCIGCMQMQSNVKLQRMCENVTGEASSCNSCYCRPMWCIECMGKWFASRQDQNKPDTWLGSKCTCPICRAQFCMLDVCKVISNNSH